jgi:hypothetical protein
MVRTSAGLDRSSLRRVDRGGRKLRSRSSIWCCYRAPCSRTGICPRTGSAIAERPHSAAPVLRFICRSPRTLPDRSSGHAVQPTRGSEMLRSRHNARISRKIFLTRCSRSYCRSRKVEAVKRRSSSGWGIGSLRGGDFHGGAQFVDSLLVLVLWDF